MLLVDAIAGWFRNIWYALVRAARPRRRTISFVVAVSETAPPLDAVQHAVVHVVHANGRNRWAMLRCPCGCNDVVTLSLQDVHHPHWKLARTASGKPTLYPSIRKQEGCRSHFWIREGRVHWC